LGSVEALMTLVSFALLRTFAAHVFKTDIPRSLSLRIEGNLFGMAIAVSSHRKGLRMLFTAIFLSCYGRKP
jgi:hypothetical protein